MLRRLLLIGSLLCLSGTAAAQTTVPVDVLAAYLHIDPADIANSAVPVQLSSLGLAPGFTIRIQPVGDWDNGPGGDEFLNMLAVFSGSATLLGPTLPDRVPDAISAGISAFTGSTWPSGEPTDIAEDFVMLDAGGVTVGIPPGATHLFVTVADIYYRDNSDPDGDFGAMITLISTTAVPTTAPHRTLSAYPNPFRIETAIDFHLERAAPMRIDIHDVAGHLVRALVAGSLPSGHHSVTWDGRDSSGRRVAAGTYFAVLDHGERPETIRVSLLR